MKWTISSVKPPYGVAALRAIHAIQEAGWTQAQLQSSLMGASARVRVAVDSDSDSIEGANAMAPDILGFVLARRIADSLEIDLVAVTPSKRRLGIGRSLLSRLIEAESRSGLGEARLELASSNDPARALYQGLGFVVVGKRKRYYPDGDDALLLSRRNVSEIP